MRPALLALALLVASSPAGHAAPKPVCHLVVDPPGDTTGVPDDGVDLLGADVASNARDLTVAFRVAAPATGTHPTAPTGRAFLAELRGQKGTTQVFLRYVETPNAVEATYGYYEKVIRQHIEVGRAKVKAKGGTLFLTLPIGALVPYGRFTPGSRLSGLRAQAGRYAGVYADRQHFAYNIFWADETAKGRTYVAGSPSCVRVGGPA